MTFKNLKAKRKEQFGSLKTYIQKQDTKKSYKDERFWEPTKDAQGNSQAIIRFIPPKENENLEEGQMYVHYWSYGFQGPGNRWYIANSLRSVGKDDPVYDYNTRLYESENEEHIALAKKNKRRLNYVANIYVVKDPAKPENEGKVFLFRYGKQIADMIKNEMIPSDDDLLLDEDEGSDKEGCNVFDLWEGKSFKIDVRKGDSGFPSYLSSKFLTETALAKTDKELEEIWSSAYDIYEFIDPDGPQYEEYDKLLERLQKTLGIQYVTDEASQIVARDAAKAAAKADKDSAPELPSLDDEDEDDDFEATMKKLEEEAKVA